MYIIQKRFDFSASHQLSGLPEGHQCARLHGHNYQLILILGMPFLDEKGMVVDYGELDEVKTYLDENFEHRHINDKVDFNPTAENLAKFFFDTFQMIWPMLTGVIVKETEKTEAYYSPVGIIERKRSIIKDEQDVSH